MELPAKGPWEHPYYELEDAFVNVSFTDTDGREHRIGVRHKVTGEGRPMVLVHGLMTSSYSWRYVLEPLGRRYRVFAPDLVGAGATDKPLELRYSVANVARFVAAYVKTVTKEPPYLIGNSLGGLYSVQALLDHPTLARRFVLMHSPGYPLVRTTLSSGLFHTPGLGKAARSLIARVGHRYTRTFIAKNVHYARKDMMSEEEVTEYGRIFETLDGGRVFAKILDESLDPEEHASIIFRLRASKAQGKSAISCPVKLLWAKEDPMVPPSFGPLYHEDLPGSELVWMADASHFLHVDAPERTIAEITRFDRETS